MGVARNAYNLPWSFDRVNLDGERMPQCIAFGKEAVGEGLINDGNFLAVDRVLPGDCPAGDDSDSRGFKVLAGNAVEHRDLIFLGRVRVSGEIDIRVPNAVSDRRTSGKSR